MRAIVQEVYGAPAAVLRLSEHEPVPVPGDDEVLVRVHASSANPWDWHFVRGEPVLMRAAGIGGVRRPRFRVPGGDVAGTVEQVGASVRGFVVGDAVYGFGHGAFADYVAVPQGRLAGKPPSLSFEQAAAVPLAAITALQAWRTGGLSAGQRVLVMGASGGVGTFAVQLARHLGAHVTGVCSTRHLDLVRELGADEVIDYTTVDPTSGPASYDLVLQLGGTYSPRALRRILVRDGVLLQSYGDGNRWTGPLVNLAMAQVLNPFVSQRLASFVAKEDTATLDELTVLIEAGHLRPVIDRTVPLSEAAEAIRLVEDGSPAGKVVVRVD
jgi:NADPH:quinone reductase-like Zn-dependent oxidoreductase